MSLLTNKSHKQIWSMHLIQKLLRAKGHICNYIGHFVSSYLILEVHNQVDELKWSNHATNLKKAWHKTDKIYLKCLKNSCYVASHLMPQSIALKVWSTPIKLQSTALSAWLTGTQHDLLASSLGPPLGPLWSTTNSLDRPSAYCADPIIENIYIIS